MDERVSDLNQPSHLLSLRQDVLLPLCLQHKPSPILTIFVADDSELYANVVLPKTDISAAKQKK